MSKTTIGIVVGNHSGKVFETLEKIQTGILKYCSGAQKAFVDKFTINYPSHQFVMVHFSIANKNLTPWKRAKDNSTAHRALSVHFSCHSDGKQYHDGEKLIISLGCDEMAKEIIQLILAEFISESDVYFIPDEYSDECLFQSKLQ